MKFLLGAPNPDSSLKSPKSQFIREVLHAIYWCTAVAFLDREVVRSLRTEDFNLQSCQIGIAIGKIQNRRIKE
jgi:hypothetical protein